MVFAGVRNECACMGAKDPNVLAAQKMITFHRVFVSSPNREDCGDSAMADRRNVVRAKHIERQTSIMKEKKECAVKEWRLITKRGRRGAKPAVRVCWKEGELGLEAKPGHGGYIARGISIKTRLSSLRNPEL